VPDTVTIVVPPDEPDDAQIDVETLNEIAPEPDIVEQFVQEQAGALSLEVNNVAANADSSSMVELPGVPQSPDYDRRQEVPTISRDAANPYLANNPVAARRGASDFDFRDRRENPVAVSPPAHDFVEELARQITTRGAVAVEFAKRNGPEISGLEAESAGRSRGDTLSSGDSRAMGEAGVRRTIRRRAMPDIAAADQRGSRFNQNASLSEVAADSPLDSFLRSFDHIADPPGFSRVADFPEDVA